MRTKALRHSCEPTDSRTAELTADRRDERSRRPPCIVRGRGATLRFDLVYVAQPRTSSSRRHPHVPRLAGHVEAVHESGERRLGPLWRARNHRLPSLASLRELSRRYGIVSRPPYAGSDRQRRQLRTGQLSLGDLGAANAQSRSNRGERHPNAKLTADDVLAIRRMARCGATYRSIGSAFGVSHANVGYIVRGEAWQPLALDARNPERVRQRGADDGPQLEA